VSGSIGTRLLLVILAAVLALTAGPKVVQGGSSYLLQIVIFGVASGAIYALIALGYTMVYGIIELINFAHGDVFTLGAFISLPVLGIFGIGASSGPAGLALFAALLAASSDFANDSSAPPRSPNPSLAQASDSKLKTRLRRLS